MRRRIQAVPIPGASPSFGIGVTLTPVAAAPPRTPFAEDPPAPSACTPTGPYAVTGVSPYTFGEPCGWVIYMLGVTADDTLEWAVTWDDMDSSPDSVFFVIPDEQYEQTMAANVLQCTSFSTTGIVVYATVNGTEYGPLELECVS